MGDKKKLYFSLLFIELTYSLSGVTDSERRSCRASERSTFRLRCDELGLKMQSPLQISLSFPAPQIAPLAPVRRALDAFEVESPAIARFLCRMVPSQCPFARDIYAFNRRILRIPPLCKLNPLYDEVVGLRFRALCYLADRCGEDVSCYS